MNEERKRLDIVRYFIGFSVVIMYLCQARAADVTNNEDSHNTLIDYTHAFVTKNIYEPVAWFDNFFSDKRTFDEGPPTSSMRWQNTLRWDEGKQFTYRTFVHANVRLPKATKKLRLIINADDEDDPTAILPDDPVNPGFEKREENERLNVGFRYNFIYKIASKLHVGTGIKFKIPLGPYVRVRYRYALPIGASLLVRFTETVMWRDPKGWKETTQLDFEKLITQKTMLRWSNSATYEDPAIGIDWGTALGLQYKLSKKSALSFDFGVSGITQSNTVVNTYRTGIRFRRNFYRDWLFYELEPEQSWPRDENKNYMPQTALTFRIEVQFG